MTATSTERQIGKLAGLHIALAGRLAGMSKREAQQLFRDQGGQLVDPNDPAVNLVVVGEQQPASADGLLAALNEPLRELVQRGAAEVVSETALWQRLGMVDAHPDVHRLYTPAMLAQLVRVPLPLVRRWHRRGLIVAEREVRRLPYFNFQEVAVAGRLAELLAAGVSPEAIEKKLAALAKLLPGVQRPLAELSVVVEGKRLLLRVGHGLVEPGGQLRLDFAEPDAGEPAVHEQVRNGVVPLEMARAQRAAPSTPEEIAALAADLEDAGELDAAADIYRAAMAAGGPRAELCFRLAELLYRQGDVTAARERYYISIELDEDYVEARANLGCVLAETGQLDMAVAAFEGALAYHGDYADVHYHLARALDVLERREEAERHWEAFLLLAPDSPWADEATERLKLSEDRPMPERRSLDE